MPILVYWPLNLLVVEEEAVADHTLSLPLFWQPQLVQHPVHHLEPDIFV